jgi:hypothetical protein
VQVQVVGARRARDAQRVANPAVTSTPTRRPRSCAIALVTIVVPLMNSRVAPISSASGSCAVSASLRRPASIPSL